MTDSSNPEEWAPKINDFIRESRMFRSMFYEDWASFERLNVDDGRWISLEFAYCFDPRSPCTMIRQSENMIPLSNLASFFDRQAREHASMIFFITSRFSTTILGWFYSLPNPTMADINTVLGHYVHSSWGTMDMPIQNNSWFDWYGVSLGFRTASEALKISAQKLHSFIQNDVTVHDVMKCEQLWANYVAQETVVLMLDVVHGQSGRKDVLHPTFYEVVRKLKTEIVSSRSDRDSFQVEQIDTSFIDRIRPASVPHLRQVYFTPGDKMRFLRLRRDAQDDRNQILELEIVPEDMYHDLVQHQFCGRMHPCAVSRSRRFDEPSMSDPRAKRHRTELHHPHLVSASVKKPLELEALHCRCMMKMRNIILRLPVDNSHYDLDFAESENEEGGEIDSLESQELQTVASRNAEPSKKRLCNPQVILNADMQIWISECLGQDLVPVPDAPKEKQTLFNQGDLSWVQDFVNKSGWHVQSNISAAKSSDEFAMHFKFYCYIETQFALMEALQVKFPQVLKDTGSYLSALEQCKKDCVGIEMRKISPSQLLIDVKCTSVDPQLNKTLVREISGMTIAIGYAKNSNWGKSCDMQLILIRSVHYDTNDYSDVDGSIAKLHLRVSMSRSRMEKWGLRRGGTLFITPLMSFATHHREFRSCHDLHRAPERLKAHVFGKRIPQPCQSLPAFDTKLRRQVSPLDVDRQALRRVIDPGALAYITEIEGRGLLTLSQIVAIETVLSEMGAMKVGSSSISLIRGPPGTGKTTCLYHLIGAINHMTGYRSESLGKKVSKKPEGKSGEIGVNKDIDEEQHSGKLKMLVCAPTNLAVDKMALAISTTGLMDVTSGTHTVPDCLRIGRPNYDYKELKHLSLQDRMEKLKNTLQDRERQEEKSEGRRSEYNSSDPDSIQRLVINSTVMYFCTNMSCGSAHFRDLRIKCDVVIMDEAANSSEPASWVPVSSLLTRADRCHVVLAGDHEQLGPPMKSRMLLNRLMRTGNSKHTFYVEKFFMSSFERLFKDSRVAVTMLSEQMRTHPDIGRTHSNVFYDGCIKQPEICERFLAPYNQPSINPLAFSPLTMVDTSLIRTRRERLADPRVEGSYVNDCEASEISKLLSRLIRSTQGDLSVLVNQIALLVPYKYMVAYMSEFLARPGKALCNPETRKKLNVLISTVDGVQGGERDVVFISTVRSNTAAKIGFLSFKKRFNVMTSRSRKLMVLLGDRSTLKKSEKWLAFWNSAMRGDRGSAVMFAVPDEGEKDLAMVSEVSHLKKIIPCTALMAYSPASQSDTDPSGRGVGSNDLTGNSLPSLSKHEHAASSGRTKAASLGMSSGARSGAAPASLAGAKAATPAAELEPTKSGPAACPASSHVPASTPGRSSVPGETASSPAVAATSARSIEPGRPATSSSAAASSGYPTAAAGEGLSESTTGAAPASSAGAEAATKAAVLAPSKSGSVPFPAASSVPTSTPAPSTVPREVASLPAAAATSASKPASLSAVAESSGNKTANAGESVADSTTGGAPASAAGAKAATPAAVLDSSKHATTTRSGGLKAMKSTPGPSSLQCGPAFSSATAAVPSDGKPAAGSAVPSGATSGTIHRSGAGFTSGSKPTASASSIPTPSAETFGSKCVPLKLRLRE